MNINDPPPAFALTDGERRAPFWLKIKTELESRLRIARGKLEGNQPEQETAILRGQIAILKGLIALGDEPPNDGQ